MVRTLKNWINNQKIDEAIGTVFSIVADCAFDISKALKAASIAGDTAAEQDVNVQGEVQKKLDVVANDIFLDRGRDSGVLAAMVSEELDDIELVPEADKAHLALVFDPLDGSSNLEINGAVGSIFSVLDVGSAGSVTADDVLQAGTRQLAAGYVLYGPATLMVLTTGQGVAVFSLDEARGEFVLVRDGVSIPADSAEFAINASRQSQWYAPTRAFIDACIAGKAGPFGKSYNMRWCAAMVADLHRILTRGGVFLYPEDEGTKDRGGRLRLLYEANPMAMIVEAAGGAATTGTQRILDVEPVGLHQRIGIIIGSRNEVERARRFYE